MYSVNNFTSKKKSQSIAQGKGHIIAIALFLPVYVMPQRYGSALCFLRFGHLRYASLRDAYLRYAYSRYGYLRDGCLR